MKTAPARINLTAVMPGLVPGIHALLCDQDVDGRDKPGHDVERAER
jgi:hypothetical protein